MYMWHFRIYFDVLYFTTPTRTSSISQLVMSVLRFLVLCPTSCFLVWCYKSSKLPCPTFSGVFWSNGLLILGVWVVLNNFISLFICKMLRYRIRMHNISINLFVLGWNSNIYVHNFCSSFYLKLLISRKYESLGFPVVVLKRHYVIVNLNIVPTRKGVVLS